MTSQYKYKTFVEDGIAALNRKDMESFLSPTALSPNFHKHLGPESMNWPSQTRAEWFTDLTSGFVGEMYVSFHVTIQAYWEDVENRSAIAWCNEKGLFVDDQKYEQTYVMRYQFDEDGLLVDLWELTDSALQKGLVAKWEARVREREEKARKIQQQTGIKAEN